MIVSDCTKNGGLALDTSREHWKRAVFISVSEMCGLSFPLIVANFMATPGLE